MKKIAEFLRFFFISPEFTVLMCGILAEIQYGSDIAQFISGSNPPDEIVKHLALLPAGAVAWMFFSGRKLLFPEKDAKQYLQTWSGYWRLRIGFDVSLIYSVLFGIMGLVAWGMDWKSGRSLPYVSLAASLIGSAICFATVYRAQQTIDEIIIQKGVEP